MKRVAFSVLALAALSGQASAQFSDGWEARTNGSLVGQDNWFQPVAGSNDWQIGAYNDAGHFDLPSNPRGGSKVAAATCYLAGSTFARSQRPMPWNAGDYFKVAYDFMADYQTADPGLHASNVASISVQPYGTAAAPSSQGWINLFYYNTDGDITSPYSIAWPFTNDAGVSDGGFYNPDDYNGVWPNGAFSQLVYRTWYHTEFYFSFTTGLMYRMNVTNLSTGEATDYWTAGDWYISGGANNVTGLPRPVDMRMFVGGQGNGNVFAVDNLELTALAGPPCRADFNDDGFLDFFDADAFVACFEGAGCPLGRNADYNGDLFVDFFDADAYVADFESGAC